MTEDEPEPETDPRAPRTTEPTLKRQVIEGAKERKLAALMDKQDDRVDRMEASAKITDDHLTALEQTVQQMTATM